jgi:hypothetical protein
MMMEDQFGKRWIRSPAKGRGTPMIYRRVGTNAWKAYHLDGTTYDNKYSDMDVLVFISNGSRFVKAPAFAKKLKD